MSESLFLKHRKGQVEIVVVAGLILAGALFVILTSQGGIPTIPTAPSDILLEQELVKESEELIVRAAADESLGVILAHGGYLTPGLLENGRVVDFTVFLDNGVPVAQACSDSSGVPSKELVKNLFEIAVEQYLQENIDSLVEASDKNVVIDPNSLSVNANILDDRIQVAVFLSTTINGYPIEQPYPIVEIQTKLGRILDFERDFAEEMKNNRHFETFTEHSISYSRSLPHDGALTDCGNGLDYSGSEIDTGLQNAIRSSIRPALWTSMVDQSSGPLNDLPKIYAIPNINGKIYNDLEIRFDLPDDFKVTGSDGVKLDNDEVALSVPPLAAFGLETTDVCIKTYHNEWSVAYPVVVSVLDSTNKWFRFAFIVHVDATTGPSDVDAEGLVSTLIGSFDQNIADAGLGAESFASSVEAEAANQGVTLDQSQTGDILDSLATSNSDLKDLLAGSVDTISGTEGLVVGPGNCIFG